MMGESDCDIRLITDDGKDIVNCAKWCIFDAEHEQNRMLLGPVAMVAKSDVTGF